MPDIIEVAQNVFLLKVQVPINVDSVNLYLIDGDVPTLIDAGTNTPEVIDAVHEGMKHVGMKRLEQVLITHWHVDHAGAAASFAKQKIHPGVLFLKLHYIYGWEQLKKRVG